MRLPDHVSVAVIGSGFGGIGTAIALKNAGRHDFVVLERADEVGGTWRDNTYPGCACDVPSHVYSFSFAPNPYWSRAFSPQPEILEYLRKTARDFDVLPHVHLGTEMLDCSWEPAQQHWVVTTSRGTLTADAVVIGTGPLSEPSLPDLPGLDSFAGTAFHSARWDHSWSSAGRRVAVIGTGASAVQFVPHVRRGAEQLLLFQRTAPWVLPRADRAISPFEQRLYARFPLLQKAIRGAIYTGRETHLIGFRYQPRLMRLAEKLARKNLETSVADPVKREKLRPHFTLGCKRVLLSNDYYRALDKPNADIVTDRIVEIVPSGVVTESADGTRTTHEVDTIIFGTGFATTEPPVAERIRAGRTLKEHWADSGAQALHGLAVAGFPNLFFLVGPNTGLGHNSIVLMIEAQVRNLVQALELMDREGYGAVQPRVDVQEAYNARLQRELAKTVWNRGGCASYYLDRNGRNTSLWPTFTWLYMRQMATFDPSEYVLQPRVARPVLEPAS